MQHAEINFTVEFDYNEHYDHIYENLLTKLRLELGQRYQTGEISKPEITVPLSFRCHYCGELSGP